MGCSLSGAKGPDGSESNDSDDASVVAAIVAAQLEAQKEAERRDSLRQDSIRQDSLRQEEQKRFLPTVFIGRKQKGDRLYRRPIKANWESSLLNLGFIKGKLKLKESDVAWYDYATYDVYILPFTRTLNGRDIIVSAYYVKFTRAQDGTLISDDTPHFVENCHDGISFEIKFSNNQDSDSFWNELKAMGMGCQNPYWGLYDGFKSCLRDGDACPYTEFQRSGNRIIILAGDDC